MRRPTGRRRGGKEIFDYWFAVGVEGQRIGYVNWAAKEQLQNDKTFAIGVRYLKLTVTRGSARW